jgi:hypothetical protein
MSLKSYVETSQLKAIEIQWPLAHCFLLTPIFQTLKETGLSFQIGKCLQQHPEGCTQACIHLTKKIG